MVKTNYIWFVLEEKLVLIFYWNLTGTMEKVLLGVCKGLMSNVSIRLFEHITAVSDSFVVWFIMWCDTCFPSSQTGKKLMAKCRMLIQENQELGRQLSQGRIAQLEAELALQKKYNEELKSGQDGEKTTSGCLLCLHFISSVGVLTIRCVPDPFQSWMTLSSS